MKLSQATLRARIAWWLMPNTDYRRAAKQFRKVRNELENTARGEKPHAKDRARMALSSLEMDLEIREPNKHDR